MSFNDSQPIVQATLHDMTGSSLGIPESPMHVTGSLSLSARVELVSGSVTRPLFVEPTGGRVNILSGATVTSSGQHILTWQGWSEWYLVVNASGSQSGAGRGLQFKIQEIDPIDKTTLIGDTITSACITASGEIRVLELADSVTDTFRISWYVSGTNPVFSGVNVSWVGHAAGNSIEGQNDVGFKVKGSPVVVAGVDDNSKVQYFRLDAAGNLQVVVSTTSAEATPGFNFGDVTTAATTKVSVRRTAYTEQITNAQRSVVSANAADTATGTGARAIKITYYDQNGVGPFEEILNLAGTLAVNTIASNICFIESIVVIVVGSGGVNAGIVSLKAATAGGGATIGSINAGNNRTYWCHHYVPSGSVCNVTNINADSNSTTVGAGALFTLEAKIIGSTAPELQVSDFVRLYGQSSGITRAYTSPIKVTGPARLVMYVTPESSTSIVQRSAFDFYDE